MILYIGNKLEKKGYTPTCIDSLSNKLNEKFNLIAVSDKKNKLLRMLDITYSLIKYRKRLDLILIDTYSTSNFYYVILSSFLAKVFKINYIPILHGGNLSYRLNNNKKLSKFIFSSSFINISPSHFLMERFKEEGFEVSYIPNSIDKDLYKLKKRTKISAKLLYVRSFCKIYNPIMAVKVLKKLLDDGYDATLCMVGPIKDESYEDVKKLALEYNIHDRLELTGKLSKKEWIEISSNYDIFINTTNFDNHPVSIIEAMCLGLPIISTNVGGIPYIINDMKNGLLVEKNDVNAMVKQVKLLIAKPNLVELLTRNSYEYATQFYWENIKLKWENLINKSIECRKKK